jgi:hypothetical protein
MFGRRRRAARAAEARSQQLEALGLTAAEPLACVSTSAAQPSVDLTADAVTALLHQHLGELVGAEGVWTLVPRSSDDTEVFFHDLKSLEIARTLSKALQSATIEARADATRPALAARIEPIDVQPIATVTTASTNVEPVSTSTLTTPITEPAEPTALPWTPRPVAHWAEPAPALLPAGTPAPTPARDQTVRR